MNELVVAITGAIQQSNFSEYKIQLLESIKSKDIDLVTDDDFDTATAVVKSCTVGEKAIKDAKDKAVAGMADVNSLFDAMDQISSELRTVRLSLSRKIKVEKDSRKQDAIDTAEVFVTDHIESVDINNFYLIASGLGADAKENITIATRGRSSLASIKRETMNAAMEGVKALVEFEAVVEQNLGYLEVQAIDAMSLFQDKTRLLGMSHTAFKEIIDSRLIAHKADMNAKALREKESKRIRAEFDAKRLENEERRIDQSMGQNVVEKPKVFQPAPAVTYKIEMIYGGSKIEAKEARNLIRRLFDDDANALHITLLEN